MKTWIKQWNTISILKKGFQEHLKCAREVYSLADEILSCDDSVEDCYRVSMGTIPEELFTLRRNLFSTIFQSVYQLLGISEERRHLYGQINHLNRIWVTSTDNMLDNENNISLPIEMGGESLIMSNVVAIMTADRILSSILSNSVENGDLTPDEAKKLSLGTLQSLLPSAAQEASEEVGVETRPPPDVVLNSIHRYKTGILFHIPFVGPTLIEEDCDWDSGKAERMKSALLDFGLGCQLLDDIRDVARDFIEKRNNYLLSMLAEESPEVLEHWQHNQYDVDDRLYREVPEQTQTVARLARKYFISSTEALAKEGLPLYTSAGQKLFVGVMFKMLDLQELANE